MTALSYSAERKARLGVLISGRGSNMLALAAAAADPAAPFEIALVLSNAPEAQGLAAAAERGLATAVVPHRDFPKDKPGFEAAMTERLDAAGAEILCLAGFMRILSAAFMNGRWRDRIVNIHPSLLPSFRGLDTHARALAAGVRIHGATVHLARAEIDEGPILGQAALAVRPEETPEALAARVLELEHRLYPSALSAYLTGGLRLSEDGRRLLCEGVAAAETPPLFAPPPPSPGR